MLKTCVYILEATTRVKGFRQRKFLVKKQQKGARVIILSLHGNRLHSPSMLANASLLFIYSVMMNRLVSLGERTHPVHHQLSYPQTNVEF